MTNPPRTRAGTSESVDIFQGLDRVFEARSVALVGASEKSIWSHSALDNLKRFQFTGDLHLVNPRGGEIFGLRAAVSCSAIGAPVDIGLVMVPESAMEGALDDLAEAGASGAVILSSGFAEAGAEGLARQQALTRRARSAGLRLLGPNCLGFVNYMNGLPLWTTQLRRPLAGGSVAVVSQSGATGAQIAQYAYQQRVALTHLISTGNEADIDIADAINHLAGRDEVKAIALFMESARRPDAFLAAVDRAMAAGKGIVVLKVGRSEAAAAAAQAHTGSLVGDDRVFEAIARDRGMARVSTIEELVTTAELMARLGPLPASGMALVALSGGMCEIATDLADACGTSLPALQPESREHLQAVLPPLASPANPLDMTGAAMLDPTLIEKALTAIGSDPGIGVTAFLFDPPTHDAGLRIARPFLASIASGLRASGKPGLMISHAVSPLGEMTDALDRELGLVISGAGLALTMTAVGHLARWSVVWGSAGRKKQRKPDTPPAGMNGLKRLASEHETLTWLSSYGVPVVPWHLVRSAEAAAESARNLGAGGQCNRFVLKIASPDIAHKTEIGGVSLQLGSPEEVAEAYTAMMGRVRDKLPDARIDGALVMPQREQGLEILVGTMRDPQWGPMIAVGLGGVFVELLRDTALRPLPLGPDDALAMLSELRGSALLDGYRGAPAVDRLALAQAITAIGNAALALGPDLAAMEVNPLLLSEGRIEALDGLAIWSSPQSEDYKQAEKVLTHG